MTLAGKRKLLLGGALLAALLLGGGTDANLIIDSVLQAFIVAASLVVLLKPARSPLPSPVLFLGVAASILCLFQLVPLPSTLVEFGRAEAIVEGTEFGLSGRNWLPISLAPGRTFDSLLWMGSLTVFAAALASLTESELRDLVPFVLAGVVLNVVLALMTFAVVTDSSIDFFGYEAKAAGFSNRNHFGTLIFSTMVLAIFYLLRRGLLLLAIFYCLLALTALFATASQVAAVVGTVIAVLGVAVILFNRRSLRLGLGVAAGLTSLLYFGLSQRYRSEEIELDTIRAEAFQTTFTAALENLPFGTGFGSFLNAYKVFETTIYRVQVNHAHNEYLELFLEGGIPAALLLLALVGYILRLFWTAHRNSLPALIGLIAIALHSLVDYPLRTFAISILATFLLVLAERGGWTKMAGRDSAPPRKRRRRSQARGNLDSPAYSSGPTPGRDRTHRRESR